MEDVGTQVGHPIFIHDHHHQILMSKKRDLSFHTPNLQQQQQRFNWNPKGWEWDSCRFVAKPIASAAGHKEKDEGNESPTLLKKNGVVNEENESLKLNLGVSSLNSVEDLSSRPNKRVRSGSPGNGSYPMCQVDNCKEDLSNAKDYHRRHKVCEVHSKSTKALVGKQMQRFCQQCSRFHPLSEFDEGKRSCRRRLAGHNRRRRKTQPEDITSRLLSPANQDTISSGNVDIVHLLTALAHAHGKNEDRSINCSSVPDRDQLLQILSKINTLPLPADLAAKFPNIGSFNRKNPDQPVSDQQNKLNGNASSPSTMDLLAVLSATLAAAAPDALAMLSQKSSQSCDSEKTKLTYRDQATAPNLQKGTSTEFPSGAGEKSSSCHQSPVNDSDGQVQRTRANIPLQLFSSSPESDNAPNLTSSRKYFSSDSSNPMEERSPSSSPVVQTLFPMQSATETVKPEKRAISREGNTNVNGSKPHGCILPLDLFRGSNKAADNGSYQSSAYQAGYTSSSGSDHSPSSLNSDAQDRTGRIIIKLFDKDPSHLPGTLRAQIYNWLSNCPSEMESYIRPGCVVLSIYLSMSPAAWEQLEGNLLQRVNALVQDSDFWRNARFLIHTGSQLASHKDGKIRLCKCCLTCSSPELLSVSPLAVVGGQETSILLRGRNLTNHGTKIHCTMMGEYISQEVTGSTYQATIYDEIKLGGFKIKGASPGVLGRCFIEVENGFKGNSFPVIIADATICKELRLLESEFDVETRVCDAISEDQGHDFGQARSREEILHFLNELGWLFQRKRSSTMLEGFDHSLRRFKFLLIFSVERDCCGLFKALMDMLVERNLNTDGLSTESLDMLSEIQPLNRAVKRRCRKMADLLIHYRITIRNYNYQKSIFPPNLVGPGGITPLHLAACLSGSEDMVDALTSDPQEIGLSGWNSLLDANGKSPYAYAKMTNNHSYNRLVARKLNDRRNCEVSVTIGMDIEESGLTKQQADDIGTQIKQGPKSCARCAIVATKYNRRAPGSRGLLQRPHIYLMLSVAAVCVCVCLFLRGSPETGLDAPFQWENLDYGTI
ncbi:SBP domain-containing protein [Cephalotus follicularis]|uniref:SBP domain-containing protein n=1 Tax=Cephalotus follicularis TaxID=3775 RepID=A0A1Q3BCP3_CEPFO|nr:SBP domain-containing protein [Cephalotus follicularis]